MTIKVLKLSELEFDFQNFRYIQLYNMSQEEIYQYFLQNSEGYEKLKSEMARGEKIATDMMFLVCPSTNDLNTKFTVLDGNTRLSVLKYFTEMKYIPTDYQISCHIFDTKEQAKDEIARIHTQKDLKTPWTKIAQARYNIKYILDSVDDRLLLKIEEHLQQLAKDNKGNHISDQFTYKHKVYFFSECLESTNGSNFANFFLKAYKIFPKSKIILSDKLQEFEKFFLRKLMDHYVNNGIRALNKRLIDAIYNKLRTINRSLPLETEITDCSEESINRLMDIENTYDNQREPLLFNELVNEEYNYSTNNDSIDKESTTNTNIESATLSLVNDDKKTNNVDLMNIQKRTSSKHAKYKSSINSQQDFYEIIENWLEKHENKCSKNISFRILRELKEISPEKRQYATACLIRALGDALALEYCRIKSLQIKITTPLTSYCHKKTHEDTKYSITLNQYTLLSKYVHGSDLCNSSDIYTIFTNIKICYEDLIDQLNI